MLLLVGIENVSWSEYLTAAFVLLLLWNMGVFVRFRMASGSKSKLPDRKNNEGAEEQEVVEGEGDDDDLADYGDEGILLSGDYGCEPQEVVDSCEDEAGHDDQCNLSFADFSGLSEESEQYCPDFSEDDFVDADVELNMPDYDAELLGEEEKRRLLEGSAGVFGVAHLDDMQSQLSIDTDGEDITRQDY